MKIFKNKAIAIILTALVIIVAVLFSANHSLRGSYNKTVQGFYDDNLNSGGKSIETCLDERVSASNSLASIAKKYIKTSDSPLIDLLNATEKLDTSSSLSSKCEANKSLSQAVDSVYYFLNNNCKLDSGDKSSLSSLYNQFNIVNDNIRKNDYNQTVEKFYTLSSKFPANLLCKVLFIPQPEMFK